MIVLIMVLGIKLSTGCAGSKSRIVSRINIPPRFVCIFSRMCGDDGGGDRKFILEHLIVYVKYSSVNLYWYCTSNFIDWA